MNCVRALLSTLLLCASCSAINAQGGQASPPPARARADYPTPVEGDFTIRDFRFKSGETLPELRQHYTTVGTIARDAAGRVTNAVLIMHGTGGTGRAFLREQFAGV